MEQKKRLELSILGTRGSCAAPWKDRMEYGGNTSCAVIKTEKQYLIFDAGTGILSLGGQLKQEWQEQRKQKPPGWKMRISIFLSHLHLDHITGLPMFVGMVGGFSDITVYGQESDPGELFSEKLQRILGEPVWPVRLDQLCSGIRFTGIKQGEIVSLPEGYTVTAYQGNHPGGSLLYALDYGNGKIGYGLDHECMDIGQDPEFCSFASCCDFLIFDGAYTKEDYPSKKYYGHSYWQQAYDAAQLCGISRIGISHYEWSYTDEFLHEQEKLAEQLDPRIVFLKEGMRFSFD